MEAHDDDKWNTASLRITSESMTASEITEILMTTPSRSFEKGSPLSPRNPNSMVRKGAVWILESGLDTNQPLEAHVEKLAGFIERKIATLKGLSPRCQFDLFCGFSSGSGQGSLVLDAALLRRLTVIPIDLVLDLYPAADLDVD